MTSASDHLFVTSFSGVDIYQVYTRECAPLEDTFQSLPLTTTEYQIVAAGLQYSGVGDIDWKVSNFGSSAWTSSGVWTLLNNWGNEPWRRAVFNSVFVVTTHSVTPTYWWLCPPDSGFSVDNITLGVPVNLTASYTAGGVALDWDNALESDFQYYRVYRGSSAGFEAGLENLVQESASSAWTDPAANPWSYYYKVTTPTQVHLNIYGTAGRRVFTLVNEQMGAGRHEVTWNGRDNAGQLVAAGVYLYQFKAGVVVQTQRMRLLK